MDLGIADDSECSSRKQTAQIAIAGGIEATALAETKGVTIALADGPFNGKLRSANALEVRGEGASLHVPLDRSAAALERLDACFERNSRESGDKSLHGAQRKP